MTASTPPVDTPAVLHFYDNHPINEEQILAAVRARGIAHEDIDEEVLKEHDQDHYGGTGAVDRLVAAAGIRADQHVLDVCSGMGGPARYIAHRTGCKVTGLDFTLSRHLGAQRLTQLAKLDGRVDFRHGNALQMPFADHTFDVVIGQEAWAHVPGKKQLLDECVRVAKPGGTIAFTDILRRRALPPEIWKRLHEGMTFTEIISADEYCALLRERGCEIVENRDLSAEWTEVLQARLEMYRGLKESTIARFGAAHFRKYDDAYSFFVSLYTDGLLGGALMVARCPG
jgi:ubiquinone/menaquinone biosynthesis C-methylase UbiE